MANICFTERFLAFYYDSAESAREWAKLAAKWYTLEDGSGAERVELMRGLSEYPERHGAWGSRDVIVVGGPESRS